VASNGSRSFYFGQLLEVTGLDLVARAGAAGGAAPAVVLIDGTGHRLDAQPTVTAAASGWTYSFGSAVRAGGVRVTSGALKVSQAGSVSDGHGEVYSLDGDYQRSMGGKSWRLESTTASYQVFRTTRTLVPKIALEGATGGSLVEWVQTSGRGADITQIDLASAATVVRSVSYVPGWTATYAPVAGGASVTIAVEPHDLVQSIRLPAGHWRVSFRYYPKGVTLGLWLSGAATLLLCASCVYLWRHGRRRGAVASTGHTEERR
jgi:hypothetical protein